MKFFAIIATLFAAAAIAAPAAEPNEASTLEKRQYCESAALVVHRAPAMGRNAKFELDELSEVVVV
ncbi:hypothetical protein FQN53_003688 [Emmonsiellopsis sp. PD_33]|nr:hypothetical protein FQN53_003688 [Emmonsiellopsis sp. PD_33]